VFHLSTLDLWNTRGVVEVRIEVRGWFGFGVAHFSTLEFWATHGVVEVRIEVRLKVGVGMKDESTVDPSFIYNAIDALGFGSVARGPKRRSANPSL
jgi:hypothetical protein